MPLYQAIRTLRTNFPSSKKAAQDFLSSCPLSVQQQLIAAIYLGRDHIHSKQLRTDKDIELSRTYTDYIHQSDYANVLFKKGDSAIKYLNKLEECANASGFDLNLL